MRVAIIETKYKENLQREINQEIGSCEPSDIIDIKYSGSGCHTPYGTSHYSAMIIFKE